MKHETLDSVASFGGSKKAPLLTSAIDIHGKEKFNMQENEPWSWFARTQEWREANTLFAVELVTSVAFYQRRVLCIPPCRHSFHFNHKFLASFKIPIASSFRRKPDSVLSVCTNRFSSRVLFRYVMRPTVLFLFIGKTSIVSS